MKITIPDYLAIPFRDMLEDVADAANHELVLIKKKRGTDLAKKAKMAEAARARQSLAADLSAAIGDAIAKRGKGSKAT
jgi:hypothetical protein